MHISTTLQIMSSYIHINDRGKKPSETIVFLIFEKLLCTYQTLYCYQHEIYLLIIHGRNSL